MATAIRQLRHMAAALAASLAFAAPLGATEIIVTSEIPLSVNPSPYIVQFIEAVSKSTNGAVKGKYFEASQLYNDRDGLAALGTGAVHMVWPVTSRLEPIDPRLGIASLPFALSSTDMGNKCFAQGFTGMMSDYLAPKGLGILGFARTADLMFLMKSKDIQKLEDLRGQKIRVIAGKTMLDAMRSAQASPVAMAASEMSAALAQGAIDGMLTSPAGWVNVVGPTAKHASLFPGMSLATSAVVVDKKWFDALPAAHRTAIQAALDEILARQWKETVRADEELIAKMVAQGGTYRVIPPNEVARMKARFAPAGEEFRKQNPEAVAKFEGLRKSCNVQ